MKLNTSLKASIRYYTLQGTCETQTSLEIYVVCWDISNSCLLDVMKGRSNRPMKKNMQAKHSSIQHFGWG